MMKLDFVTGAINFAAAALTLDAVAVRFLKRRSNVIDFMTGHSKSDLVVHNG
jgi:hypothetical protein